VNALPAPPGFLRRLLPVVVALVRIEVRRAASWLVAGAMLAVVALVPPARAWAAVGAGALLGLAAIGSLRREAFSADLLPARLAARVAWPLAAAAAGAAVAWLAGREDSGRMAVAVAASSGVVVVAAAVAASAQLPRLRRLVGDHAEPGPGPGTDRSPRLVGRTWADAAAMLSTVVAMAVCYFLAPEHAGWYAVVATTWFTLLAVPAATLVGGDEGPRRALVTAGPGRPRLAGSPAAAGPTLAAYAAVLGWPAAVAAAVARRGAAGWGDPRVAVVAVAGMAVVAVALVWISAARRWREDTPHAALVAAHAVAIALVARVA
jgi:hypothetical protein